MVANEIKILFILFPFLLQSCFLNEPGGKSEKVPEHQIFDELLSDYVDSLGKVNYEGLTKDSVRLNTYISLLETSVPQRSVDEAERLAYYINLYNATTIQLILRHWPVSSIRDIGPGVQIPFISGPWQIPVVNLNGTYYDLDDIEHGIIRKEFNEPRIHFALVCAARSCPPLRQEAYRGKYLNKQLSDQERRFVTDSTKNHISKTKLTISSIFKWYGSDFDSEGGIKVIFDRNGIKFDDLDIEYMDYDWSLNN